MNLKRTCAVTAGNYNFGGNATTTSNTDADAAYAQLVKYFSFSFRKESNNHLRIDRNQHTITTTATTGTNDVPSYEKLCTSSNISDDFSTTTINAEPTTKLEKERWMRSGKWTRQLQRKEGK